jgi:hypothetical protein
MIVTVPACTSITGGDVCLTGPAKVSVADFPLSAAVKTPNQVPLMKNVPLPVSRKTFVPWTTAVPKMPHWWWGGVVNENCVTCVDPAARPVAAVTHASTVAMASGRSFLRTTLPPPSRTLMTFINLLFMAASSRSTLLVRASSVARGPLRERCSALRLRVLPRQGGYSGVVDVGAETFDQLPDGAVVEERRGLRMKGKHDVVTAYLLLALP